MKCISILVKAMRISKTVTCILRLSLAIFLLNGSLFLELSFVSAQDPLTINGYSLTTRYSLLTTITLTPIQDTYIQYTDNTSHNTNTLKVGGYATLSVPQPIVTDRIQTLLWFPISSANIPPNAAIINATMKLYYNECYGQGLFCSQPLSIPVDAYRITETWDESVTWNNKPNTESIVEGSGEIVVNPTKTWQSVNVTEMVKSWVNNQQNNYGMLLDYNTTMWYLYINELWFDSREGTNPPQLEIQYMVDNTPPTTTHQIDCSQWGLNNWCWQPVTVNLTATDTESGVKETWYRIDSGNWQQYTGQFAINTEGKHTVEYYSVDNANNNEPKKSFDVSIDLNDPVTSATINPPNPGPSGYYNSTVRVILSATDTASGVKEILYKVNSGTWTTYSAPIQFTTDGVHIVRYYSKDNAGRNDTEKNISLKVDATLPEIVYSINGSLGQNQYYISPSVNVTVTAYDNSSSGIKSVKYRVDGGSVLSYTHPVKIEGAGTHTFDIFAYDNAENMKTVTLNIKIDNVSPVSSINIIGTLGNNNWYKTPVNITFDGTDAHSGIENIYYKIDNQTYLPYVNMILLSDNGFHTINYYSKDYAGNIEKTKNVSLKIDTTYPVTTINILPAETVEWYNKTVTLTLNATDTFSGVESIRYKIDGSDWLIYNNTSVTISTEGVHTFEYYSIDKAGNVEDTKALTIKIDITAPEILHNLITTANKDEDIYINATVSDANGLKSVKLYYANGKTREWKEVNMLSLGNEKYSYKIPGSDVGYDGIVYYIYAEDIAGNVQYYPATGQSAPATITVPQPSLFSGGGLPWLIIVIIIVVAVLLLILYLRLRKQKAKDTKHEAPVAPPPVIVKPFPIRWIMPKKKVPVRTARKVEDKTPEEKKEEINVEEELKKLDEYVRKGLITKEEAEESKKRLMEEVEKK